MDIYYDKFLANSDRDYSAVPSLCVHVVIHMEKTAY